MIQLDLSKLEGLVSPAQLDSMAGELAAAHGKLYDPAAPARLLAGGFFSRITEQTR